MRLISDIRLGNLDAIAHLVQKPSKPFYFIKYALIGRRYAAKLRSLEFSVGNIGDVFILHFNTGICHGVVIPDFDGFCRSYSCGLEVATIDEMAESQRHDFFVTSISKMLTSVSTLENLDIEKVRNATQTILDRREETEIPLAYSNTEDWHAEVVYTINENSKLSVVVTNKHTRKSNTIGILSLDDYQDAQNLVRRARIKGDSILVSAKTGRIGEHTLRRYSERLKVGGFICSSKSFEVPLSIL